MDQYVSEQGYASPICPPREKSSFSRSNEGEEEEEEEVVGWDREKGRKGT